MSEVKMKHGHYDIVLYDFTDQKGQKFFVVNSNSVSCSFPYDKTVLQEMLKLVNHLLKKEIEDDKAK